MYLNFLISPKALMKDEYGRDNLAIAWPLSLVLGWMSRSMFTDNYLKENAWTINNQCGTGFTLNRSPYSFNWICSLLKYGFPVVSTISRSQTHQRMDFAVPLDRVGMRLLLMESLSTPVYRHSFSAPTPTINTLQQIGLTITKAFAIHIRHV